MDKIDLHIHTTASDGIWSAETVFIRAKEKGLKALSITDHDSIDNSKEGEVLAKKYNVDYVSGVELSALYNGQKTAHILGYGIDLENKTLNEVLSDYKNLFLNNDKVNVSILQKLGYEITNEDVAFYYVHKDKGFFPLYNAVKDKGYTDSVFKFYKEIYLKHLKHINFYDSIKIISIIKKSGGVAILAHPGGYSNFYDDYKFDEKRLKEFLDFGIDGIEAISQYHNKELTDFYLEFAKKNDLIVTGGSDCHGEILKREIGEPNVTYTFFRKLLARIKK